MHGMSSPQTPWPSGVVEHVAILYEAAEDEQLRADGLFEVAAECLVDHDDLLTWVANPLFLEQLAEARQKARDRNTLFELKARQGAEDALESIAALTKDTKLPATARLRAFELLTRLGGLYKSDSAGVAGAGGPTFHITFRGDSRPGMTISPSPEPVAESDSDEALPVEDFSGRAEGD